MKATELMIGDWVFWKNKPVQVVRVSGIRYSFNHYDVLLAYCNDVRDGIECHDISSISPIPLTPEILKKNGFKDAPPKDTDVHNLVGKWWHKSGDVYVKKYCLSHGTYAYTIGFHPHTRIENIHNVHELQHALRLCGLNDLADNFKI